MIDRNLVDKYPSSFYTAYERTQVCFPPVFASVAHGCNLLMMHPLFSCLSLCHISTSSLVFPGITSQINYVNANPCFQIYSWEPKLRLLFKTCLQETYSSCTFLLIHMQVNFSRAESAKKPVQESKSSLPLVLYSS